MPISSLIIRTLSENTPTVVDEISDFTGLTVAAIERNNIVVVTETETKNQDKELWTKLKEVSGVKQVDLIFHNFEDVGDENYVK